MTTTFFDMTYSQEQISGIVEDFWQTGGAKGCPIDKAPLDLKKSRVGQDYLLSGRCRKCGWLIKAARIDDPKRQNFRHWNDKEVSLLKGNFVNGNASACPSCKTSVRFDPIGADFLLVECERCGEYAKVGLGSE